MKFENQNIKIKANECISKFNNSQLIIELQNQKITELFQENIDKDFN